MTRAYYASNYFASYYYASYYYGAVVVPAPAAVTPPAPPAGGRLGPDRHTRERQPPWQRVSRDDDYKSSPETTNRVSEALRRALDEAVPLAPPAPPPEVLAPDAEEVAPTVTSEPAQPPYVTAIDDRLFGGLAAPPGRATDRLSRFDLAHVDLSRLPAGAASDDEEAILLLLML